MKHARYTVAVLMLALAALAAWLLWHLVAGPEVNPAAMSGEVRWKRKLGTKAYAAAVTGDTVLCAARSVWEPRYARIIACDAATGRRLWGSKACYANNVSAATMSGKRLVFVHPEYWGNTLDVLDARTGSRKWQAPGTLPSEWGIEKLDDQTVLAYGTQGVRAMALASSNEGWTYAGLQAAFTAAHACDGKTVFVTSSDGQLGAVNAATGQEVWKASLGARAAVAVAAAEGTVCAVDAGFRIRVLDAATGTPRWDSGQKAYNTEGIAVGAGRVYLADASNIACLALADGKEVWSTPFGAAWRPVHVSVSGRTLYYGGDGVFAAFDAGTGATLRQLPIEGRVVGAPAVSGDTVYFATDRGWLYAVAAEPEERKD